MFKRKCSGEKVRNNVSNVKHELSVIFAHFVLKFAVKMIPLKTNRRVLTWLCVYTIGKNTTKWQKMFYVGFTIFVFVCNIFSFGVSGTFFVRHVSVNIEKSLFSLIQIIGTLNMNYIVIITLLKRHKISAIFVSLTKIYEASKKSLILIW